MVVMNAFDFLTQAYQKFKDISFLCDASFK